MTRNQFFQFPIKYWKMFGLIGMAALTLVVFARQPNSATADENDSKLLFEKDIQPILAERCERCHGPDRQRSGFRIDQPNAFLKGGESGEPAILPGNSAKSHLVKLINGDIPDMTMPPSGKRLSPEQIKLIRRWIDQGARWQKPVKSEIAKVTTDHWSFQPIAKVEIPQIESPWIRNPIDAFILAKLKTRQLTPNQEADRRTLIRRLFLDMHGLPPTAEQIANFVNNKRVDAYEHLVDEVLASPRYGERWAQHWLDIVRFAETHGFETNTPRPNAWRYRDYVIKALNDDKPYNQFVMEQIAGDSLQADVATSFLVAGPQDQVKSPDVTLTKQQRQDELNEMINVTGSTFLGLTVSCARCHNHKFDPILQKDYYSMQAIFAGVNYGDRTIKVAKSSGQLAKLKSARERIAKLTEKLQEQAAKCSLSATHIIDDEDTQRTKVLVPLTGHGTNPTGSGRGEKEDPGSWQHFPNISKGKYSWWNEQRGKDVFAYIPKVAGDFHIWVSWGCGWHTHVTDANYFLDLDGKLETTEDRTKLGTINQQKYADGTGDIPGRPLWSGFAYLGKRTFTPNSKIILQAGKSGPATTADVLVLQQEQAQLPVASAAPMLRAPVNSRFNEERITPVKAKSLRFTIHATNNGIEPCFDELEVWTRDNKTGEPRNIALAKHGTKVTSSGDYVGNPRHKLEHINDGLFSNDRSWISNQSGKGWVQLDFPETVKIERITWGRDRTEQYQDRTASKYTIEIAVTPGQWQTVATSEDRIPLGFAQTPSLVLTNPNLPEKERLQAAERSKELNELQQTVSDLSQKQVAFAGVFRQPGPTYRLYRGDPMAERETVAPDILTIFGTLKLPENAPEKERRLALARWLVSSENPLTARVMVNRLWHYHFGTGIVDTPSDLGKNGGSPSHPQLLDWLAQKFQQDGWSLKKMHRLILLSSTYSQASVRNEKGIAVDAGNRLLWHFPQRRLEAEAIRDSILAVSGNLDLKMGGPGFSFFEPNSNYVRVYNPKKTFGPEEWRRMVYATKIRMEPDAVFGVFDCPDAGQPAPRRGRSTTAIQALNLFNSDFIMQQAEILAERIRKETGSDTERQVHRGFALALGRAPTDAELPACKQLVEDHGLTNFCRVLFNLNEFLFLP